MTDPLEARAIEAAKLAIDDVHDMDVSLQDYAEAAARAVLAEIMTGAGDAAGLIARADAAMDGVTEGPWLIDGGFGTYTVVMQQNILIEVVTDVCEEPDARFIAASRQLVPALRDALAAALTRAELAECHAEALEAESARMREALEEAACYGCTCDPAYYERGLAAPDCMANLVSDDAREALGMAAVCKGSAAARAALTEDPQP